MQYQNDPFFILQCELCTSCNVSNNASLVLARTGGEWVVNQMWIDLDREIGVPENSKLVRTSFMDDPIAQPVHIATATLV